ncbi:gas vesicle protein GvpO [Actinocatenispora rupis]|uniref:Gas vesicle synthesis protein GvpO n=1 Tax=Actinocatenispora rupis TaxID=519421 RepID=A0A8J3NG88_9ACTN|nr:gas vesicle protein GvpO [Actinocatenispora rupis]GID14594.1 hypothetical protein Aru02nite_54830 [Actinocatenispora rupis]
MATRQRDTDRHETRDRPRDTDRHDRQRREDDRAEERPRRRTGRVSATGASRAAVKHVGELIARDVVGVVSVRRGDEDGWVVGVEAVEDRHVPSSADILAIYELELDDRGDLRSYQRVRRYTRGSTGGQERT